MGSHQDLTVSYIYPYREAMLQTLNRFSEQFIPDKESKTQDEVGRMRVFVNSSFLAAAFSFGYIGITLLIGYPIGTVGLAISGALFLSFPLLLKLKVPYLVLANFFIAVLLLSLIVYITTQGGIRIAVVAPWLVFITCIAVLFLNIRYALFWTIATALSAIILLVLEYRQVSMPVAFDTSFDPLYRGIVWVGLLFLVLLVINVFKISEEHAKTMLAEKNDELESAMQKLRQTQDQLIQSEKLASLGQVTAGIAHEIQNPLNFIKNFSEFSLELMDEAGDYDSAEDREEFLQILRQNLLKISEHSQRTDRIVRNMLDHAHIHGNERVPTSLNSLCSDVLSMSLHALKVKEHLPQLTAQLLLDPADPYCGIMPSDTGRILVNLVNNAVYSLQQKCKIHPDHQPVLALSTTVESGWVVLRIEDNGMGIPADIQKDIFKPFFTTKPTGEGTGLGLSLSNTIMQAQDGMIALESSTADRTVFKLSFRQ